MSVATIQRYPRSAPVVVTTSTATSSTVRAAGVAGAVVFVSGVTASATLTVHVSSDDATYRPLYASDGQPATVSIPAAGGAVAMPDAVFGCRFLRLTAEPNVGTAAAFVVSLKS